MPRSKFGALPAVKKKTADDKPKAGRPRRTSEDSVPVTLHMSPEVMRLSRMKLLEHSDLRPLSKIGELLFAAWVEGKVKI